MAAISNISAKVNFFPFKQGQQLLDEVVHRIQLFRSPNADGVIVDKIKRIFHFHLFSEEVKKILSASTSNLERAITIKDKTSSEYLYFSTMAYCGINLARVQFSEDALKKEYEQLNKAVNEGNCKAAKELLDQGLNPNYALSISFDSTDPLHMDPSRVTALGRACLNGDSEMVDLLMSKGANPNFAIMANTHFAQVKIRSPNNFMSPYVMPAWMALLNSTNSTAIKQAIWKKLDNQIKDHAGNVLSGHRPEPFMPEAEKWWLTRSFFKTTLKPEELHFALKQRMITKKDNEPNKKPNESASSVLSEPFFDVPNKIEVMDENNRSLGMPPVLQPPEKADLNAQNIKLGAVMIFHGAELPEYISVLPHHLKSVITQNPIIDWAGHSAKVQGDKNLFLYKTSQLEQQTALIYEGTARPAKPDDLGAEEIYQTQLARLKDKVGLMLPEDNTQANAVLTLVKSATAGAIRNVTNTQSMDHSDISNIIGDYVAVTPTQFKDWVADECMKVTFGPSKADAKSAADSK